MLAVRSFIIQNFRIDMTVRVFMQNTEVTRFYCVLTVEFMAEEVKKYEMGKRWLAKMMGVDVETFTDNDVQIKFP